MQSGTALILLAAGNSERMGQCKFLLPMRNGLTFYENIVINFSIFGVGKIIVVTQPDNFSSLVKLSDKNKLKPVFVLNDFPGWDRFYSLQLGLKAMGESLYCFIHNADCPFVDADTLKQLYANRRNADFVSPEFNEKKGHPVLINKKIIRQLNDMPMDTVLKGALKKFTGLNIPVSNELIHVDIDTPEDYKFYFE